MILASRHQSTIRIYGYPLKIFSRWCATQFLEPLLTTAEMVLEFLQDGLRKELSPAILRRQVAALDSIYSLRIDTGASLSRHPLVQKFLRGVTALRPTSHHQFPSWQLHEVLLALMGPPPFEPMGEVDLK